MQRCGSDPERCSSRGGRDRTFAARWQDRHRRSGAPSATFARVSDDGARTRRLPPAWTVVAVTSLVLLITAGSRAAPGALLTEMEDDTGWSNAALSLAAAIGLVMYGLGGPFAGALMGRFGPWTDAYESF